MRIRDWSSDVCSSDLGRSCAPSGITNEVGTPFHRAANPASMHQADAKGAGMLALTGYVDRLSAPPGGTIAFKISSTLGADYTADLVRIRRGDPNPAGPGLKLLPVDLPFGGDRKST